MVKRLLAYQQNLLDDESKHLIALWGRATGKSFMSAICALKYARKHSQSRTLVLAPYMRQVYLIRDYVQQNLDRSFGFSDRVKEWFRKWILRRRVYFTSSFVKLRNNSLIMFFSASNPSMLRGRNPERLQIDNFEGLSKKALKVINAIMVTDPSVLIFATPTRNTKELKALMKDPSYNIQQVPTRLNPLVNRKFLEEQKVRMGLEKYTQEFRAEFVSKHE